MAPKMMEMCGLTLVLMTVVLWGESNAQSSCTNVIISMSPCLNYITGNSTSPSSSCCSQLGNVVRSNPQCLCQVLSGGGSAISGLNINQTQALSLPTACNVQTPPVSRCNAASPTGSPSGTSDTPSKSDPGNGSKNVPTTDGTSSDGSSIKLSFSILFSVLLVVSRFSSLGGF